MKNILFLILAFTSGYLGAQTEADFENFNLSQDTFYNGADGSGGFSSGQVFLPNNYSIDFDAWTGWALSSKQDSTSAGFQNQYSCIAASGAEQSKNYAVGYAFDPITIRTSDENGNHFVNSIMINNATYPFLSMRDGDAFSKKFGGPTGADPDFFLLTIKGYVAGELIPDSIDFFLADFRADDSDQDYLVKDWTSVDLSRLGGVDSLVFSLSSTDNGIFGMNTPAYFCIDNVSTESTNTTAAKYPGQNPQVTIFPNPAQDILSITHQGTGQLDIKVVDLKGRTWRNYLMNKQEATIEIGTLRSGIYVLEASAANGQRTSQLLLKQ